MSDRDRLIGLLQDQNCPSPMICDDSCKYTQLKSCYAPRIADIILDDGWIRPPCKVGATLYRVMADKRIKQPYEYKVIGFWYSADENCNNLHLVRYVNGVFESSMSVPFSEFNNVLFLTKEEAEERLKELRK